MPYGREELLKILAGAEAAEVEVRLLEERSTTYWLLEYLAREKQRKPLNAVVLDNKGYVELEDYYVRGKTVSGAKFAPGETVCVLIESVDPVRGEIRFRMA